MVVFHTFCFVFSLRLGAIIIGVFMLITNAGCFIFYYHMSTDIDWWSNYLEEYLSMIDISKSFVTEMKFVEGFYYYLISEMTFYLVMMFSCMFLIIGAYQCKPDFIYPFLIIYIPDLYLLFRHLAMLLLFLIHLGGNSLGSKIFYTNIAYFLFVFYVYIWICVYCLVKAIKKLQSRLYKKLSKVHEKSEEMLNKWATSVWRI